MPVVPQHQDHLSNLSQAPQDNDTELLVHRNRSVHLNRSRIIDEDEPLFVDEDDSLFLPQDEAVEVQRKSKVARNSQASSRASTLIHMQSTNRRSAEPAARKSARKPRMLSELEPHNESPEPDSETGVAVYRKTRTSASSHLASSKPVRKSLMLREIEAHNQSPEPESDRQIEALYGLTDDWSDVHLTRKTRKDLVNLIKGKPPESRDSLNIRRLMLAEFSGIGKGTKTFYAEGKVGLSSDRHQILSEEEDGEEDFVDPINTNSQILPQPTSSRRKMLQQAGNFLENIQRNQTLATELASTAWATWDNQKGQSPLALY